MKPKIKHTPGEWKYHLGRGANPRFHVQTMGGYQIASTPELKRHPQAHNDNEAHEANARLIAAAPELLEAAKRLVDEFKADMEDYLSYAEMSAVDSLIVAIAKAEGK